MSAGRGTVELLLTVDAMQAHRETQALAESLRSVDAAAGKTSAAANTLTTTTKASGAAMAGLGRQLNDVFVSLMSGASPLQVATQQGEQLGFAFKEAGGLSAILSTTLGATAAAAAGLAAQVGLGYLAWLAYTDTQREANAVAAVTARGMADLAPLTADLRDSVIDLREAVGDLTEAEADMERASIKAFDALQKATANTRAEMAKLRAEQGSVKTQIVDTVTSIGTAIYGENAPGMKVFDYLTTSSKEYQDQLDAGNGVIEEAQKQTKQLVAAKQLAIQADADEKASKAAVAAATRADADAKRRAAEATREEARAWAALQSELSAEVAKSRHERELQQAALEAYWDQTVKMADLSPTLIQNAQDEAMAIADLALAYSQAKISAEEYAKQVAAVKTASDNAAVSNAASTVGQYGSTSGLLNTVSNAGPWGALIAGIIDILRNFRQTLADINDLISSVLSTIGDLPRIIVDEIRTLLKTLPEQLGGAIGSFIGELPAVIVEVVRMILSPTFWIKVLTSFIDGLVNGLLKALGFDTRINLTGEVDKINGSGSGADKVGATSGNATGSSGARGQAASGGGSRTVGPSSYGGRAPGWASATVAKNNGGVGAAMSTRGRMGSRGGQITFTIDESTYADAHKSLQKRGVI